MVLAVKNSFVNAGTVRDTGTILGWGRSPERGHGNPSQYSCLENPMDRGARWATVHKISKSQSWTQLKCLCSHTRLKIKIKTQSVCQDCFNSLFLKSTFYLLDFYIATQR